MQLGTESFHLEPHGDDGSGFIWHDHGLLREGGRNPLDTAGTATTNL